MEPASAIADAICDMISHPQEMDLPGGNGRPARCGRFFTRVVDGALAAPLGRAEQALARLEVAGEIVRSLDWFSYAFVRKEAVISSQILHPQMRRKREERNSMWYTTRTTAAPMVATSKLSRLSPVTPDLPKL